jgi:hypothetical protein
VGSRENTLRGVSAAASHARRTHCKHGHALTGDNVRAVGRELRRCVACHRARAQVYMAKKRIASTNQKD